MQVQVTKWGNSLGLRLPRALAQQTGIREGQKVNVVAEGGRLVVEVLEPKHEYSLAELLAASDYSQPLTEEERAWVDAPAVGGELI